MASSSISSLNSSDLHSPIFLLSNICHLISIRLDSSNYVLWKFQFSAILRAHRLFGFIDGSVPIPSRFLLPTASTSTESDVSSTTPPSNPQFEDWIAKDQALMTLINATLSQTALAYVVGCKNSHEMWATLEKHYSSSSRSNVVNLKSDLQTIVKKSSESINTYFKRIKEIRDKLANVSTIVHEEDLLIFALNGLPSDYNTFRTSMRTRSQPVSFEELHVLLVSEESALEKQLKREEVFPQPSAMAAVSSPQSSYSANYGGKGRGHSSGRGRGNSGRGQSGNSGNFGGRGRGFSGGSSSNFGGSSSNFGGSSSNFGRGQSGSSHSDGRPPCQICNRHGHAALDCYNRMNYHYQGRHPSMQLAAMVAVQNQQFASNASASSMPWLADSGCNAHVTSDLSHLSLASDYSGEEQVSVGSGQSLPITHSGQVFGQNFVPRS